MLVHESGIQLRFRLTGVALLALFAAVASAQEHPPKLTICELRNNSTKYLGKTVIITGEVHELFHGTGMSSPECNLGALLVESRSLSQSQARSVTLFRERIGKTRACSEEDRALTVTVRGRLGIATARNIEVYRIVADEVFSAEFVDRLSKWCANRELPPPNITLPPPPALKLPER